MIKYFQNDTFGKKNITTTEVVFIQFLSYNVVSKQKNKNENTECHDMFLPFKSHLNSKQGSLNLLLFGSWTLVRSSHSDVFCRRGVLRNIAKFTEKHLRQSLFFNKVGGLRPATLLKRDSGTGIFIEFSEISKKSFFDRTPLAAASF